MTLDIAPPVRQDFKQHTINENGCCKLTNVNGAHCPSRASAIQDKILKWKRKYWTILRSH